jgi:hypothetical protein
MSSNKTLKMIAISEDNYKWLSAQGHVPESFNDVLTRIRSATVTQEPRRKEVTA